MECFQLVVQIGLKIDMQNLRKKLYNYGVNYIITYYINYIIL